MQGLKYFNGEETIDTLRAAWKRLVMQLHPDKGGNHESFTAMKNEYDYLCGLRAACELGRANEKHEEPKYTRESEIALREMIEKLVRVPGIQIEICGTWLWITGNTFMQHTTLSALGLKFSGSKKAWYYAASIRKTFWKGRYSLQQIRNRFGSEKIESTATRSPQLQAA